ncbi:MAG TPA: hypothetical protein VFD70_22505 [Anaerolineae bacterium]|nr:hypothetical protein [Anaerolineae bacterium]
MPPVILLVLIIFAVLVLLVLITQRSQESNDDRPRDVQEDTYEFDDDNNSAVPTVRRRARIVAPAQIVEGSQRRLVVSALPLTDIGDNKPPAEKGITAILLTLMNPSVQTMDTKTALYNFDPPLKLSFDYNSDDAAATTMGADGKPQLSLITAYPSDSGWKFERLATTVEPNGAGGGTLTAWLYTLHPADPVAMGRP